MIVNMYKKKLHNVISQSSICIRLTAILSHGQSILSAEDDKIIVKIRLRETNVDFCVQVFLL